MNCKTGVARRVLGDLVLLASAVVWFGCNSSPALELADTRRAANNAFAAANGAFESGDFETARQKYEEALDIGGLNPDNFVLAKLKLAVCWGYQGKYDEALAALDEVEPGAGCLDQIYAARSFVYRKKGDRSEARDWWNKARRINRQVKEF